MDNNNNTGTFNALRRGTGEGVDMTGTWLSQDLVSSASATMQVTQTGNALSGTIQGGQNQPLLGTVTGNQVTFTMQTGGNAVTWTGYLSVDGNTVTGYWVNVGGPPTSGGWRMTRQ